MALTPLKILYRGPLSSCNYDCHYCPFAKRHETATELRADRKALAKFVDWGANQSQFSLSILFTPWGEALVRSWYQDAVVRLGHAAGVSQVAIQTNLSCGLDWLARCDRTKVALWCTYHPSQISRPEFLDQCRRLEQAQVHYSVGVVGLRESFAEIESLRDELPPHVYLWINAYKDEPDYYTADEIDRLARVDPLFRLNLPRYRSLGRHCSAGQSAISVDGDGNIRRCHFVRECLGNLYVPGWENTLRPRSCPNETCGCYIGYIHLPHLKHAEIFHDGLLPRIPRTRWSEAAETAASILAAESAFPRLPQEAVAETLA